MSQILINCGPRETRVALLVDGVLRALRIERVAERGLVGNIYLGRVVRIMPGLQSVFVDIGLERAAFMAVSEVEGARGEDGPRPIESLLHEGQTIMVQVIKDAIGSKGPRLTMAVSISGRHLIYLPRDNRINVSQRIEDPGQREELRRRIEALRGAVKEGGFIVRTTVGEGSTDEDLREDMECLARLWRQVLFKAERSTAPALLRAELSLPLLVLRDLTRRDTSRILVDDPAVLSELREFAAEHVPSRLGLLELYEGVEPLFDSTGVEREINRALSRRVDLESGGYLVIDQAEAMTVIDVNTGSFIGRRDFEETAFKTNLEAARAIALQLRLRNLGGIIIVDFIDMEDAEHRQLVRSELCASCVTDSARHTISDFTSLGLIEIARHRVRNSLSQQLCETCPTCGGTGRVRTARTVCYSVMREVVREWRRWPETREFKVVASREVIDMFLSEEAGAYELLREMIGKPIQLEVENEYGPERWDVIPR